MLFIHTVQSRWKSVLPNWEGPMDCWIKVTIRQSHKMTWPTRLQYNFTLRALAKFLLSSMSQYWNRDIRKTFDTSRRHKAQCELDFDHSYPDTECLLWSGILIDSKQRAGAPSFFLTGSHIHTNAMKPESCERVWGGQQGNLNFTELIKQEEA